MYVFQRQDGIFAISDDRKYFIDSIKHVTSMYAQTSLS
jgi:hypothetical protein